MSMPSDLMSHLFSLPPVERYSLAHQLLDSIDDTASSEIDNQFLAELRRRREEMLQGREITVDWRGALTDIESSLSK